MRTSLLLALAIPAAYGYGVAAVTLLQPLIGWLATPVAILAGRGLVAGWFWLLCRRDLRRLAAIQTRIENALTTEDKPGDHGQA